MSEMDTIGRDGVSQICSFLDLKDLHRFGRTSHEMAKAAGVPIDDSGSSNLTTATRTVWRGKSLLLSDMMRAPKYFYKYARAASLKEVMIGFDNSEEKDAQVMGWLDSCASHRTRVDTVDIHLTGYNNLTEKKVRRVFEIASDWGDRPPMVALHTMKLSARMFPGGFVPCMSLDKCSSHEWPRVFEKLEVRQLQVVCGAPRPQTKAVNAFDVLAALPAISGMTHLVCIAISKKSRVSVEDLRNIAKCPNLCTLVIRARLIEGNALLELTKSPHLTCVTLNKSVIVSKNEKELAVLARTMSVDMQECSKLSPSANQAPTVLHGFVAPSRVSD